MVDRTFAERFADCHDGTFRRVVSARAFHAAWGRRQ
jgi:hypothetical protein